MSAKVSPWMSWPPGSSVVCVELAQLPMAIEIFSSAKPAVMRAGTNCRVCRAMHGQPLRAV